jgi:hypothetical protein
LRVISLLFYCSDGLSTVLSSIMWEQPPRLSGNSPQEFLNIAEFTNISFHMHIPET